MEKRRKLSFEPLYYSEEESIENDIKITNINGKKKNKIIFFNLF